MPVPEHVEAAQYRLVEVVSGLAEILDDLRRAPSVPISPLQQLLLMEADSAAVAIRDQCKIILDYVG